MGNVSTFILSANAMNLSQRELFKNNKITEALCQFSFKNPLEERIFKKIGEKIEVRYSKFQDIPFLHLNFNLANAKPEKLELKGLKGINEAGDRVVQLFSNNASIHQVGNYEKWEKFRDDILYVAAAFSEESECEISRIDLRTINLFEFDLDNFNPAKYFNVFLNYPKEYVQSSNYNFTLEQVYEPGKCMGVIRGNSIHEDKKIKFFLDLSFVEVFMDQAINIRQIDKITDCLEKGHIKLHQIFTNSITEDTKSLIR